MKKIIKCIRALFCEHEWVMKRREILQIGHSGTKGCGISEIVKTYECCKCGKRERFRQK